MLIKTNKFFKVVTNLDEQVSNVFVSADKQNWTLIRKNMSKQKLADFLRSSYITEEILTEETCSDCGDKEQITAADTKSGIQSKPEQKQYEDTRMNSTDRYLTEFINEGWLGGDRANLASNEGVYNTPGAPGGVYAQMLAAETTGSPAFAVDAPTNPMFAGQTGYQISQAEEGLGKQRPVGPPSPSLFEQTKAALLADMVELSRRFYKAACINEAKELYTMADKFENLDPVAITSMAISLSENTDEKVKPLVENLFEAANVVRYIKSNEAK